MQVEQIRFDTNTELQKLRLEMTKQDMELKHMKEKIGLESELSAIKNEQAKLATEMS